MHAAVKAILLLAAPAAGLTWLGISDVHFGHDLPAADGTTTTALALNIRAVAELNALALNASWPASLGGGLVQVPAGVILSGDIIDNGDTEAYEIANFTRVYGLKGGDGLLSAPIFEGRGNHGVSPWHAIRNEHSPIPSAASLAPPPPRPPQTVGTPRRRGTWRS